MTPEQRAGVLARETLPEDFRAYTYSQVHERIRTALLAYRKEALGECEAIAEKTMFENMRPGTAAYSNVAKRVLKRIRALQERAP